MFRIASLSLLVFLNATTLFAWNKKAIALGEIQWQAPLSGNGYDYSLRHIQNMVHSLRSMVTTALTQTRKYEVIERAQLSQILDELGLIHDSGLVDPYAVEGTPEWGRLQGIQWLVLGAITQFSIDSSGFSSSQFGGYEKQSMMLVLDLRIVDVESGRLIDAVPLETKVFLGGSLVTKETGAVGSKQSAGQKMTKLLRQSAKDLVHRIVGNTLPIRILNADKNEVVLNYGKGLLDINDQLVVYQKGDAYVDPDTGESEAELIEVGRLRVFQTQGIISKARYEGKGSRTFSEGDICRLSVDTVKQAKGPMGKLKGFFKK